jgi:predicted amidophosphoribosyltransferase
MVAKGTPQWKYKLKAIREASVLFGSNLPSIENINHTTLVPIPPSKVRSNPAYDDRVLQALNLITPKRDVQELILFKDDMEPAHLANRRKSVSELKENIRLADDIEVYTDIILFDDVITTGCHFKACKQAIQEAYRNINVIGVFLARRVPENTALLDFWDL